MTESGEHACLPQHIAIVMDGNGRWASQKRLPVSSGHKAGVEALRDILQACRDFQIKNLTLFAFSSENWQRPALEVKALMTLFSSYLDSEINELNDKGICLRFIGRRDRFPAKLVRKIDYAEALTKNNTGFNLSLAVDYGGQWDIVEASRKIAAQVKNGELDPELINEDLFQSHTCLSCLPMPDFFIRTSGEYRISNFLLWQLAYAELYFTDTLWPDFDREELEKALKCFASRERRFGGRDEAASAQA